MSSPYRDSLDAQRDLLKSLDARITQLEESYTELFWKNVAPTLRLEPPKKARAPAEAADVEELGRAVAQREERLAALQRVEASFDDIEAAWRTPEAKVPPVRPSPVIDIEGVFARLLVEDPYIPAFERAIQSLDPALRMERSDGVRTTMVVYEDVPFQLRCQSYRVRNLGWQVDLTVQTTIPPLCSVLELSPQGFGNEILVALRLRQDIRIDDEEFDSCFVIGGDVDAARAMLTEEVRDALMLIARLDVPRLKVGRGLASLVWHYEPDVGCLRTAMHALKCIREAPPTRALRKP